MLSLIIFTMLIAIGVVLMKREDSEICELTGLILAVTGCLVVVILGIIVAMTKISSDAEYEKMKAKHDALMTADKGDIVTLTKDIAEYNGQVKAGRELKKSPWVGLYQYPWWDDLDTIEIGSIGKE